VYILSQLTDNSLVDAAAAAAAAVLSLTCNSLEK
jgi:hypothetical protein